MILTQCAACAAPLGLSLGKKCGRCSTRYCGPECQKQHWEAGGHDRLCKPMKKAGGAEQYNANKRYAEAVSVAAEKCADDTKGQTCFICTQALHWKTKEGLVRGCSCRGTAGFVHVSCLAEQAKILCDEAEANNLLGTERFTKIWDRWYSCSLCEQKYHGVVMHALGWACWKTYAGRAGRPETDALQGMAMGILAHGLSDVEHHEDALSVREAQLSTYRRCGVSVDNMFVVLGDLANTYQQLGRNEEALSLQHEVYLRRLKHSGEENIQTLREAVCYAIGLIGSSRFEDAKALLRKTLPVARRVFGENEVLPLTMRTKYARALYQDPGVTLSDLREAVSTLEDVAGISRRVMSGAHPITKGTEGELRAARAVLRARSTPQEGA